MTEEPQPADKPSEPPAFMTLEQQAKVVEWFKDKGTGDHTCPVCQHNEWTIEKDLVAALVFRGDAVEINRGYLLVTMFCTTCAYAMFFHAGAMGIGPHRKGSWEKSNAN